MGDHHWNDSEGVVSRRGCCFGTRNLPHISSMISHNYQKLLNEQKPQRAAFAASHLVGAQNLENDDFLMFKWMVAGTCANGAYISILLTWGADDTVSATQRPIPFRGKWWQTVLGARSPTAYLLQLLRGSPPSETEPPTICDPKAYSKSWVTCERWTGSMATCSQRRWSCRTNTTSLVLASWNDLGRKSLTGPKNLSLFASWRLKPCRFGPTFAMVTQPVSALRCLKTQIWAGNNCTQHEIKHLNDESQPLWHRSLPCVCSCHGGVSMLVLPVLSCVSVSLLHDPSQ